MVIPTAQCGPLPASRIIRIDLVLAEGKGDPIELSVHRGQTFISCVDDAGWNGEWAGAVTTDGDGMAAEMAVPWSTLEGAGLSRDSLCVKSGGTGPVSLSMQDARQEGYPPLTERVPMPAKAYTVTLDFAFPDDFGPCRRVFDVNVQGRTVFEETGWRFTALVEEFKGVEKKDTLAAERVPRSEQLGPATVPVLAGLEVMLGKEGR